MPLSFHSRPVGDVTVLERNGRIVEGAESASLLENPRAASTFNRRADALPVIELLADFSRNDAGEAGRQLLAQVNAIITPAVPGPLN